MKIWSKIITALQGGTHEIGEAIVDSQAIRILQQEVRDATEELNNSRASLAEMMAVQKVAEKKCDEFKSQITEHESYAIEALEKNDDVLASDLAEKIAQIENQLSIEQNLCDEYKVNVDSLREAIKQADTQIKQLKLQVDTVEATESVQKVQASVAEKQSGSQTKLTTAMESLERIKKKQALKNAQFEVAEELAADVSEESLKDRLKQAGIVQDGLDGNAVLARLKNQLTPRLENDSDSNQ